MESGLLFASVNKGTGKRKKKNKVEIAKSRNLNPLT